MENPKSAMGEPNTPADDRNIQKQEQSNHL
jgi:hypothetical protein